ncbi:sel1 repeat family protein, partial [bacterium]|nr:sel1 repeat family protein [bacterium]
MNQLFFIFLLLFFLPSTPLFSSPVNSLKESARNGDAQAAYELGLYYSDETSAEQNWDYAVYWFFHASLKGHQKSQVALSLLMKQGLGLPKNEEESNRWLEKAANSGFTPAQVRVAENFERGHGTLRDVKKAIDWYTSAADRGDPNAQTTLCRFYELGEGVEKDLGTAMKLCRIAATNGFAPAQYHLGRLYLERFRDPDDFKMAIHWLHQSAEQGFLDAQTHLATFYREGIGVKRDYNVAKHLLTEAAGSGNARAAYELGNLILDYGSQDAQSSKEAFAWLEIAAEGGHSNASRKLAGLYKRGGRVMQNPVLAADWRRHGEQLEPSNPLTPTPAAIVRELGPRATRALIKKMEPELKTEDQGAALK